MQTRTLLALTFAITWPLVACAAVQEARLSSDLSPPEGARAFATGTGFFVASGGALLTARHVVRQCLRIDILSKTIDQTSAAVIATDDRFDLAVLRVVEPLAASPATLPMSVAPASGGVFTTFGYPISSRDARRAVRAELTLINATLHPTSGMQLPKSGYILWLDGPLEHGDSGSPVLDQEGAVVGILQGMGHKDPALDHHFEAIGTWPIFDLLNKTEFKPRFVRTEDEIADPERSQRAAIVRIICWLDSVESDKE